MVVVVVCCGWNGVSIESAGCGSVDCESVFGVIIDGSESECVDDDGGGGGGMFDTGDGGGIVPISGVFLACVDVDDERNLRGMTTVWLISSSASSLS